MEKLQSFKAYTQKYKKTITAIFYVCFTFLLIITLKSGAIEVPFYSQEDNDYSIKTGWIFTDIDGEKSIVNLPFKYKADREGAVNIERVLRTSKNTTVDYNTVLVKTACDDFVASEMGSNICYRYRNNKTVNYTKDIQYRWHIIVLHDVDNAGTISFKIPLGGKNSRDFLISDVIYGKKDDVFFSLLQKSFPLIVISAVIILNLSVQMVLRNIVLSYGAKVDNLKYLFFLLITILAIIVSRIPLLSFIPIVYDFFNYLFFICMVTSPIFAFLYIKNTDGYLYKKQTSYLVVLSYIFAMGMIFSSVVDINILGEKIQGITYTSILIAFSCGYIMITSLMMYRKNPEEYSDYFNRFLGFLALFLGIVYDLKLYLLAPSKFSFTGIGFGSILLAFIMLFSLISISIKFLKKKDQKLFYELLASQDTLTGLKNSNTFRARMDNLNAIIEQTQKDIELGVMVIDINNLKYINDNFGHGAGDKAIKYVADSINFALKENWEGYRIGGDEFLVLYPKSDAGSIEDTKGYIRQSITGMSGGFFVPVTVAIGSDLFDIETDKNLTDTQIRVDKQMYKDKFRVKRLNLNR